MAVRTGTMLRQHFGTPLGSTESGAQRMVVVVIVVMIAAEVVAVMSGTVTPQNAERVGTRGDKIHRQQQNRYDSLTPHPSVCYRGAGQ